MKFIKENWFKLGILSSLIFSITFLVYYFSIIMPKNEKIKSEQETGQKLLLEQKKQELDIAESAQLTQSQATTTPTTTPNTQPSPITQKTESSNTAFKNQPSPKNILADPTPILSNPAPSITPTTIPSVSTNNYCSELKNEHDALNIKLVSILQNGIAVKDGYNSENITNLDTAYTQLSAQKNSYYAQISQLISSVSNLSAPSFGTAEMLNFKQNFLDGANGYQNAFDLKIQAFKYIYDKPSSFTALDNSKATLEQANNKVNLATFDQEMINKLKSKVDFYL